MDGYIIVRLEITDVARYIYFVVVMYRNLNHLLSLLNLQQKVNAESICWSVDTYHRKLTRRRFSCKCKLPVHINHKRCYFIVNHKSSMHKVYAINCGALTWSGWSSRAKKLYRVVETGNHYVIYIVRPWTTGKGYWVPPNKGDNLWGSI